MLYLQVGTIFDIRSYYIDMKKEDLINIIIQFIRDKAKQFIDTKIVNNDNIRLKVDDSTDDEIRDCLYIATIIYYGDQSRVFEVNESWGKKGTKLTTIELLNLFEKI